MTRNMILANQQIFELLDAYCEVRERSIKNAGAPRWIATNAEDREVLKHADFSGVVSFGPGRAIARFDQGSNCFICTIGFDRVLPQGGLVEIEVGAGLLTALLAEVKPRPRSTPTQVKDIVEAFDRDTDPGYKGHDADSIAPLFPPIRAFAALDTASEETWRIFFLLCVGECRNGETWIDDEFADTLQSIAELDLANVPYQTLCRSIFDADPAAIFLALYRCLESLYAYSSAQRLIRALKATGDWVDVAVALEDQLGWYPREASSLADLLSSAPKTDLERIFHAIKEPIPEKTSNLPASAANLIYRLRNNLVHFRPIHRRLDFQSIEWNRLCTAVATLVWHVYSEAFPVVE